MKKIPETKARMVRCGRMCPMLLMTKAVKTKSRETMGKGVAVRTISGGEGGFGAEDERRTDSIKKQTTQRAKMFMYEALNSLQKGVTECCKL